MSFFISKEIEDKIDQEQFYHDNIIFLMYENQDILSGNIISIKDDQIKFKSNYQLTSLLIDLIINQKTCNISYNEKKFFGKIYKFKQSKKEEQNYITIKAWDKYERNKNKH